MNQLTIYQPKDVVMTVIDAQCCFMPAIEGNRLNLLGFGELPVEGGHEIVPVLNELNSWAIGMGIVRVATKDWHPETTAHFGDKEGQ